MKVPSTRIILCASDLECEAIVRRGRWAEWVADIVPGTLKDLDIPGDAKDEKPK